MPEWEPISEIALRGRVAQGEARMSPEQLRVEFHAILTRLSIQY
jgi:hypothetical protein